MKKLIGRFVCVYKEGVAGVWKRNKAKKAKSISVHSRLYSAKRRRYKTKEELCMHGMDGLTKSEVKFGWVLLPKLHNYIYAFKLSVVHMYYT